MGIQIGEVLVPQTDNHLYDIPGFEGLYKITRDGRIYGVKRKHWMNLSYDEDGYLKVKLYKEGKGYYYRVHRLVAMTFISNSNNLPVVNHINSIRDDNRVENLEWCTVQQNNRHALEYGNRDYSSKEHLSNMAKKRWERDLKPVEMYTKQGQYIKTFINAGEASKQTGIKRQYIVDVCNGVWNSTGGYIFKYTTGK